MRLTVLLQKLFVDHLRGQAVSIDPIQQAIDWVLRDNLIPNTMALDTPIYRIVPVKYLVPDLMGGRITLTRVIGWEDTHEAAYFNRTILYGARPEPVGLMGLAKDWFGQCWSMIDESDALWRIYNPDGASVRIQTTAKDLVEALARPLGAAKPAVMGGLNIVLYAGAVEYLNEAGFAHAMETPLDSVLTSDGVELAKMLLKKREPFAHEGEVRLLFQSGVVPTVAGVSMVDEYLDKDSSERFNVGASSFLPKRIQLPFDWGCVTNVMLGPRTDVGTAEIIVQALKNLAPHMAISKSTLYGPPSYPMRTA
jgi:hypothetical protein